MDEASLAGENHYALYENGEVHLYTLRPEDVGLTSYPLEAITEEMLKKMQQFCVVCLKENLELT